MKFIPNTLILKKNLKNLYESNIDTLTKYKSNINIGGDHSMAIGSVCSTLNIYGPNIKVIWIDAHADINTRSSSSSGNVHGMPLSFITGLDKSVDYDFIKNTLPLSNLCYIGIRDLDMEEINIINKFNIKKILSEDFNSNTDNVISDLINWIGPNTNTPVHLSFDVDSLDPKYIQCTGTKSPNGLELSNIIKFLTIICKKNNIVNVDISELNLYEQDYTNKHYSIEKVKSLNNFKLLLQTIYSNI